MPRSRLSSVNGGDVQRESEKGMRERSTRAKDSFVYIL